VDGKIYVYPRTTSMPAFPTMTRQPVRDARLPRAVDGFDRRPVTVGRWRSTSPTVPWAGKQMWAPDAARKDGTYYLYFPVHRTNRACSIIGVASGTSPTGPFTAEPEPIAGSFSIDPAVFTDADGESYMYFGGIWGGQLQRWATGTYNAAIGDKDLLHDDQPALSAQVARLGADMKSFAEEPRDVVILDEKGKPVLGGDHERRFFEASWMYKRGDTYYFTYSTGDTHFLNYATGSNPYGPFTYRGHFMLPVQGWTTHHSIVDWNGKTWLFYADNQLSGKNPLAQRQGDRAEVQRRRHDPADRSVPRRLTRAGRGRAPDVFLGIDIGTSGVKAVALDEHGAVARAGVRRAHGAATASAVVRAGPRSVVHGHQCGGPGYPGGRASRSARRRFRRADARRDAAGRRRQAAQCRRSCGTTGAPTPSARRWRRPSRTCAGSRPTLPCPGSPRPSCYGSRATSPRFSRLRRLSCCQRTTSASA
jgi:hypothetical protein